MATPQFKFTYFDIPARGEAARLMLSIAGKEFKNERFTFAEWGSNPDLKAGTPFGQLPVLEVDGKRIAQSAAIDHYVAKLTGLMPDDPWTAALADQAYFLCEDIWNIIVPTLSIQDRDQRLKTHQELVGGVLGDKLQLLSRLVESRPGRYISGDQLTHADVRVFCNLSGLQSGLFDGIPADLLGSYPALRQFRQSIATLPGVEAFYSKETDALRSKGFKAGP